MKQLEEAIPEHLRLERTQPLGAPEGFTPQHPSYSARFDESVKTLPIIYVGIQYPSGKDISEFSENIRSAFALELGPKFWDQASYRDEAGYENLVFVGYWDSEKSVQYWQGGLNDDWWHQGADIKGEIGFFIEAYTPSIRDQGRDLGCYFCRYMHIVENGERVKKTYSLSAWHSLADIEKWVKADTHLAIWAAGIKHYKNAGDQAKLRLYHEMFVIKATDQRFEYFNCHEKTGILNAIRSGG